MSTELPTLRFLVTSDLALLKSSRFQTLFYSSPELINYEGHWLSPKAGVLPRVLAILLMHSDNPIGCIAGLFNNSDREFEINAWALQPQLINKGLGQNLLVALENHFTNSEVSLLTINFLDNLSAIPSIKHILQKQHWTPPEVAMHFCKIVVSPETIPSWTTAMRPRPGAEIFPWVELHEEEKSDLQRRLANKLILIELSPFQLEEYLSPELSFGLRKNSRVIGWMLVHQSRKDLLQYTCLWTEPAFRASAYGLLLISQSLKAQLNSGLDKAVFQTKNIDRAMVRLISRRLSSMITYQTTGWHSHKPINR